VVRSSATAARFAGDTPDLKVLAAEADVDRVVIGTLMRAGDEVRVNAQLVEAPTGTLLTSQSIHAPLGDLFTLQDDLTQRVVEALSPPLSTERMAAHGNPPPNPRAYELYLRANELERSYATLGKARDLYLHALELDANFAPAWAHLGRCHRVIGKFVEGSSDSELNAENALRRALAIDPDLSVTHKFYAALEADMGVAEGAVVRLVREATRRGNDPELFAGLVHALRYCGLFEESVTAHDEARRLDPNVSTSLEGTLLLTGDLQRLLAFEHTDPGGGDEGIRIMGLGLAERRDEARELLVSLRDKLRIPALQAWTHYLLAWLDRRPHDLRTHATEFSGLKIHDDPEAIFLQGWLACDAGAGEMGLTYLQRAIAKGYSPVATLTQARQFDDMRHLPAFASLLSDAEAGRRRARTAFREAGGQRLLGLAVV
jgi:tetratricopeptide (TPR) repeat protein